MFAVTISWIVITIVFLSFGDFLVSFYNNICKQNERYGLTDTFLLGMCATLIPLSISSLWLPTNKYILLASIILSITYWVIRRNRLKIATNEIRNRIKRFSVWQLFIFAVPVLSLMAVILWQIGTFDSLFYHQQNIRWNEEYAVVPGLGNVEHRFGFNSNYMLLSALFSFRFIFGESIYSLHVLVLVFIICWIIKDIIQSGYELKRVVLLIVFTGYIFIFGYSFTATSTDAIPNVVSFYIIARLLLYPDDFKNKLLLLIFVPVSLVTFKLSIAPLCLISLYAVIIGFKRKEIHSLVFLASISFTIVALWMVRNVIITGYLIFPFNTIDLFSVEWKIPDYVVVEELDFIYTCGIRTFGDMYWVLTHWQFAPQSIINWLTYAAYMSSFIIAPVVTVYCFIKKKYLNKAAYFIFLVLAAILSLWFKGGPDPRFAGGILFALMYYIIFMVLSAKKEILLPKAGITVLAIFALILIYWPIARTERFANMFALKDEKDGVRNINTALYRPFSYRELLKSKHAYKDEFHLYHFNKDISIYVSKSPEVPNGRFVNFDDPFPCTVLKEDDQMKYQDIKDIEPRGSSLQKGFRPKR
ncbi:hypothetical protein M2451_000120 [Dysgonomonas sp. PFB1-18]|uniref:LIC_10190 family membrane protein n=1 Tax=unclassified Dysgonomonas TaxID=2630389 RepID=UPI002476EDA8|nr:MULTISPECIES: hypothetical protein [unclassified Dysgonomonas]MDH6307671.1 hypothetical protein [Dysgonomonas sp. PF1-14]MDH6337589.1 hypothetical protein [Dysgonomonas sp. PF1-16]MDH6378813.1 hypothetical protein [Dysgonomonas sp. PFB1-18]MDH6396448.1 hypothetical protein [Dysgonomonas sp. PF1-23]